MSFDIIQMPCKYLKNKEDKFSWRLLVFTIRKEEKPTIVVGRHSTCDFRIDPPDLPCFVSRKHAKFYIKEDQLFIQDLGSTNGTFKNNVMLAPHEENDLQHGDLVAFGCKCSEKPDPGNVISQRDTPFLFRVIQNKSSSGGQKSADESLQDEQGQSTHAVQDYLTVGSPKQNTSVPAGEASGDDKQRATEQLSTNSSAQRHESSSRRKRSSRESYMQISSPKETCLLAPQHTDENNEAGASTSGKRKKGGREKAPVKRSKSRGADGDQTTVEKCASFECAISNLKSSDVINWVQCDSCDKWFHTTCVGCKYDEVKNRTQQFHCGFCAS